MNEDKAARYHRLRRRVDALGVMWSGALLGGLSLTDGAHVLSDLATALTTGSGASAWWIVPARATAFVLLLAILHGLVALPLAYYRGFLLERRFGLSNEHARTWLWNHAKTAALFAIVAVSAAWLTLAARDAWPRGWWLAVWAAFVGASVVLARIAPVVLLPLLFTLTPLRRDSLHARLHALAARVRTTVPGAYEWTMGHRTRRVQAALVGLGATRRILISDTMLADYSDDEIEVILAHELSHHRHHDVWIALACEAVLSIGGLLAASSAVQAAQPVLRLRGPSDPAVLPALLLGAGTCSLLATPLANLVSRWIERRADRGALELTQKPDAFIAAMRRMAAQNLAEERPPRLARAFFYTHPPVEERIRLAREWAASEQARGVEGARAAESGEAGGSARTG